MPESPTTSVTPLLWLCGTLCRLAPCDREHAHTLRLTSYTVYTGL